MKIFEKNHFWNLNWNFCFRILKKKLAIGNGKIEKNRFWNSDWNLKKLKYVTKIWNEKKLNFHFFNLEFFIFEIWNENFCLIFFKKFGHIIKWKWKKLKWRNHIFRLCYRDKTSNNTPIPPIPPMRTTAYHMCKLWWYTINPSRWILSYGSFSNSGTRRKRAIVLTGLPFFKKMARLRAWGKTAADAYSRETANFSTFFLFTCSMFQSIKNFGEKSI
jgi:hypothetical protein